MSIYKYSLDNNKNSIITSNNNTFIDLNCATMTFKVKYNTQSGQEIRITGNIPELGDWDLSKSLIMTTSKDLFPYWITNQKIKREIGKQFIYKYIVYDTINKKFITENVESDRVFSFFYPGSFEVIDEQGNKKSDLIKISNENFSINKSNSQITEDFINLSPTIVDNNEGFFEIEDLSLFKNYNELLKYDPIKLEDLIQNQDPFTNLSVKITSDDRIIIVSALLPVEIKKNILKNNYEIKLVDYYGIIYTLMYLLKEKNLCDIIWIGMLKDYNKYNEDELTEIMHLLEQNNIYMVIINDDEIYKNFWIYINKIMIPVFVENSFDMKNEYFINYEYYFKSFLKINQLFANTIYNLMEKNDLIMINDLHLLFIPNYLLYKNNNAKLGIYFHTNFPSSDVLKGFPYYTDILRSILLCDVIGFHYNRGARQFLTSVQRTFGLFYQIKLKGIITIENNGRRIIFRTNHAGIDYEFIEEHLDCEEYKKTLINFNNLFKKKHDLFNFVSIDSLKNNNTSGLIIKFEAFKKFVIKNNLASKTQLIQVVIINNDLEYGDLSSNSIEGEKDKIINKSIEINKEVKNKLINLIIVEKFSIIERYSLFTIADCFFYLQKGEGYCIYSQEYILIQKITENNKYGLILGECIGVSNCLKGVIFVNSYDLFSIISGLEKIYFMPKENKEYFYKKDLSYVNNNSILKWAQNFFIDLKSLNEDTSYVKKPFGFKLNFNLLRINIKFSQLIKNDVIKLYQKSKKRLIFFNYENTLQQFENKDQTDYTDPKKNMPNNDLLDLLKQLTSDNKNKVYIVSGHKKQLLDEWFGDIKNLGISAEYGFYYKNPGYNLKSNKFLLSNLKEIDWSYKESIKKILQGFTEKTEGSFIDERESMISWIYLYSDHYFGHIQANEMYTHLRNILDSTDLICVHGNSSLDIKPYFSNKGYFLSHIIQLEFNSDIEPDFIMAIGNNESDEEMFKYLNFIDKKLSLNKINTQIISCTMLYHPSQAKYYLSEINNVIDLIESMICNFKI